MGQTAVVPSQIVAVETAKVLGRSTPGTGSAEQIDCTAAGRAILDDADASAQRTTLGLGTMATETAASYTTSAAAALIYGEPTAAMVGSFHNLQNFPPPTRWRNPSWKPYQTTTIVWTDAIPVTATGTVSTPTIATTNYRTSHIRSLVTSSASAGNFSQVSTTASVCYIGDSSGVGGFFYCCIFGFGASVSASQPYVGLNNGSLAAATTEPSVHISQIVMAADSTDANFQIMHNDNAGASTKVDLGASFPAHTINTVYRFWLYCDRNASSVQYQVDRLDSAASTSGTLSTNLPANTTLLRPQVRESNNATAAACLLELFGMDIWVKY